MQRDENGVCAALQIDGIRFNRVAPLSPGRGVNTNDKVAPHGVARKG